MWAIFNDIPGSFRNISFALLQSHSLFSCKTAEAVRWLIGEGAKVGDRRGDDATPLMIQVSYKSA